ncbi:MAG TPA: diacylglycerol kinase family protein [Anaeromyxobacter sp.]|nr:diacylglycerol kinase family protein [Anaeromyxobacter sp.]
MVGRVLLLLNTASGTGHPPGLVERLRAVLDGALGPARAEIASVSDHAAAKRRAHDFVAGTPGRCAVVVGGGNGTVRAAVEGIAGALGAAGGDGRVVLAALRLGSGNVFARHFGVPADPEAALRGIVENLAAARLARCELVRCDVEDGDGTRRTLHATSLVAFGALGRVPGDLARFHRALPSLRRLLARLLGIERLTRLEYVVAFALRALRAAVLGGVDDRLRLVARGRATEAGLFAGALVKYDLDALPVRTRLRAGDPAVALAVVERMPLPAVLAGLFRPRRLARRATVSTLGRGEELRVERTDGARTEFFLDEDPESFDRALTLRLSGALPVAPGPDYRWPEAAPQEVAS